MQNENKSLGEVKDFIDLEIYQIAEKIAVDIEKFKREDKQFDKFSKTTNLQKSQFTEITIVLP